MSEAAQALRALARMGIAVPGTRLGFTLNDKAIVTAAEPGRFKVRWVVGWQDGSDWLFTRALVDGTFTILDEQPEEVINGIRGC